MIRVVQIFRSWLKQFWGPFIDRQNSKIELSHNRAFRSTEVYVNAVESGCNDGERTALLRKMAASVWRYFNLVEREVLNCDGLSGGEYERWKQEWIVSSNRVLSGAVRNIKLIRRERRKLALPRTLFEPSDGALRNVQAFLAATDPVETARMKQVFQSERLPIAGFDQPYIAPPKDKHTDMKTEGKIAVISGIAFMVVMLCIALFVPNPTDFQYTTFRIILALAAAAFATVIPGILNVTVAKWLKASGALAVFVVVYFYSPANLVSQPHNLKSASAAPPTPGK